MDQWPKNKERRLVQRLLNIWRDAQLDGQMPSLERIFLQKIGDVTPHTIILDATNGAVPRFVRIGEAFDRPNRQTLIGKPVTEVSAETLLYHAVASYKRTLARRVPIISEGSFTVQPGSTMLYRSVVLPTTEDGVAVNALICAANGKIVADDAE